MVVNKVLFSSGGNTVKPELIINEHITNMTNNTTPSPLIAKGSNPNTESSVYTVFRTSNGSWIGNSFPTWISLDFGAVKKVNKVRIVFYSSGYISDNFLIEGSNDGLIWDTLRNVVGAHLQTDDYWLDEDFSYRQYRVNFLTGSATTTRVMRILFMHHDIKYTTITSSTELDFISHGLDMSILPLLPTHKLHELPEPLDILYYTDDVIVTSPKLEKTLNYSPLDELNGQVEFVTYLDKPNESRKLEYIGKPIGQFSHLINATLADDINSIVPTEVTDVQISSVKYVISPDSITWYSFKNGSWIVVDTSNKMNILLDGMTRDELILLQRNELQQIIVDKFNIGILLTESFRTSEEVGVDKIDFGVSIRANNAELNSADFSILNTTAEINVTFAGNTLSGNVDDVDKGKVQYSVILNGTPYYPSDGSFTILQPSPANLRITLDPKLVLIGQPNTIEVFFRDAWGNTDTWNTTFIGTMTGLLFADANGNYYSTEEGTVLQQLDFGTIIAGQTTLEHEIKLKNTYGYTVKNIKIAANQLNFPTGLKAQFGTNITSFEALDELVLNNQLNDGDEITFYIRLQTQAGTIPTPNSAFDIEVTADKV